MKRLPSPVIYGLWLVLGLMAATTIISILVPDSALSLKSFRCEQVMKDFNATKWEAGEYSSTQTQEIRRCG